MSDLTNCWMCCACVGLALVMPYWVLFVDDIEPAFGWSPQESTVEVANTTVPVCVYGTKTITPTGTLVDGQIVWSPCPEAVWFDNREFWMEPIAAIGFVMTILWALSVVILAVITSLRCTDDNAKSDAQTDAADPTTVVDSVAVDSVAVDSVAVDSVAADSVTVKIESPPSAV